MTNLTLSREMQNMAERLAENAHDIWAKKKKEELVTCGGVLLWFYSVNKEKDQFNFLLTQ